MKHYSNTDHLKKENEEEKKTREKENRQFFLTKILINKWRRNEGNGTLFLIHYDTNFKISGRGADFIPSNHVMSHSHLKWD